jgi:hypothetical protein
MLGRMKEGSMEAFPIGRRGRRAPVRVTARSLRRSPWRPLGSLASRWVSNFLYKVCLIAILASPMACAHQRELACDSTGRAHHDAPVEKNVVRGAEHAREIPPGSAAQANANAIQKPSISEPAEIDAVRQTSHTGVASDTPEVNPQKPTSELNGAPVTPAPTASELASDAISGLLNLASSKPANPPAILEPDAIEPSAPKVNNTAMAPTEPAQNLAVCRDIIDRASTYFQTHEKYTCRVTRQEKVGRNIGEREIMLMNFRLSPRSVYYEWLDPANDGRECIYVEGQNEGKLISMGGKGDLLLAGRRVAVDPDGFLAKSKSRYSIREAGLDNMVRRLDARLRKQEQGDLSEGPVMYMGRTSRDEFAGEVDYLRNDIPPGADKAFPSGGVRHWYFEPSTGRLALMYATEPGGGLLEYYLFDRFVPNEGLTDADFTPDLLWPGKDVKSAPTSRSAALPETQRK